MNREEALMKIKESLTTEVSRVIAPPGSSYEEHVRMLAQKLLACVIEPIEVKVTSTCAPEGEFELYKNSKVWGIAREKSSWLLTLDDANEFALGWGDDPMKIMMHGFSSPDALGEWCA